MATTGINAAITKGISDHFYLRFASRTPYWRDFFNYRDMDSAYIDAQGYEGYQLPGGRMPGEPIASGQFKQSFPVRYVPYGYGLMDSIPVEWLRDDMYGIFTSVLPARGGLFADSFDTLLEYLTSGLFNNYAYATSGTIPFGSDGVCLFSTAHPTSQQNATTWSNRPATDADFGIATYHAAWTNMTTQKRPDNLTYLPAPPVCWGGHPSQRQIALQVLQGTWERGTADRNENIVKRDNITPYFWPYFTKSGATGTNNAWFMLSADHMLMFYMRDSIEFDSDSDFVTRSELYAGTVRVAYGWSDARGSYGSTGQ